MLSIKNSEAGYGINYVHMLAVLAVCQVSSISSISSMIFVDEAREVCTLEPGRLQPCPQASIEFVVGTKTCNPNEWNFSVRFGRIQSHDRPGSSSLLVLPRHHKGGCIGSCI